MGFYRSTTMYRVFVSLLFLIVCVSASLTSCPRIKATAEGSKISATWSGYNPKEVVAFEWAVVEGNRSFQDNVCSSIPLFSVLPNVLSWTYVRKSSQVESQSLNLDMANEYRVILRITSQDGSLAWVSSEPIEFIHPSPIVKESAKKSVERDIEAFQTSPCLRSDCPIDIENNCRNSRVSTREKLDVLYGAPQWPNSVGASSIYRE